MNPLTVILIVFLTSTATLADYYGQGHENHHDQVPNYHFEYGVHDPHTHDIKSQYEHREHDHVHGAYSLKEPDGTQRIVEYIAGPHTGFQAVVRRIGHAQHPAYYGHHDHGDVGFNGGGNSFVGATHWGHGSGR
ncbi:hypothetical protein ABEB36_004936 [Hypothenemus hampei]|uniref:Uncharacterized protein n=1 Tax=Hypothenemus hampei TaxID=57062 RepID=A0ABD1F093_HYPHA